MKLVFWHRTCVLPKSANSIGVCNGISPNFGGTLCDGEVEGEAATLRIGAGYA